MYPDELGKLEIDVRQLECDLGSAVILNVDLGRVEGVRGYKKGDICAEGWPVEKVEVIL